MNFIDISHTLKKYKKKFNVIQRNVFYFILTELKKKRDLILFSGREKREKFYLIVKKKIKGEWTEKARTDDITLYFIGRVFPLLFEIDDDDDVVNFDDVWE